MALAVTRDARLRVAEYRVQVEARPDPARWTLLGGEPLPMPPVDDRHNRTHSDLTRKFADRIELLRRGTNPDGRMSGPGGSIDIPECDGRIEVAAFYLHCGIS
ncbi:hypothetical protein [Methylobacterium sp. A54F]